MRYSDVSMSSLIIRPRFAPLPGPKAGLGLHSQADRRENRRAPDKWTQSYSTMDTFAQGNRRERSRRYSRKDSNGLEEEFSIGPRAGLPPELYSLHASLKMWSRKETDNSWQAEWQHETKGRASFRYAPVPSEKVLQLHEGLSQRQSAILGQLRTDKIGLRDFLFRRKMPGVLDPICRRQGGRQTVRHVLLMCRKLRELRKQEHGHLPHATTFG